MIDRDLAEIIVALALILACAITAISTAQPSREERAPGAARRERGSDRRRSSSSAVATLPEALAPPPFVEPVTTSAPPTGRPRPRILTGEPAAPEPHRPAARRAFTLVAGITVLALGGAVGLLVLVRTLVAMFKGIGG